VPDSSPRVQLLAALDLFKTTIDAHPYAATDIDFTVLHCACLAPHNLDAGEVSRDIAWLVSRVTFALGPPGGTPDLELARVRIRVALDFLRACQTDYGRIGEPYPPRPYVVFMLVPGEPDRVTLLPKLDRDERYERVADGIEVYAALRGRRVPWPPFEPPAVSALAAEDWATTGFFPAEKVVKGSAKLPLDARVRVGG